jgi:uncharacterized membrane protein
VHLKEHTDQINVDLQRVSQFVIFSVVNRIFENKFNMYLHVYCIVTMCNKITLLD